MASLGRNMIVANTFGSFALLVVMILGGFIITKESIPVWWIWGYWISPMMYAQNAISVNEFHGHSWSKNITMGEAILTGYGLFKEKYWFWIGVGALFGYAIILNILFTMFLTILNPIGNLQAVVSKDSIRNKDSRRKNDRVALELRSYLHSNSLSGNLKEQKGMVLPFQPLSMCFRNINYYVDVPEELKKQGIAEDRLQLLVDVTGAFRPGILTALVGVSGAGKTTLMDVLAGRKTGGLIEGSITISGQTREMVEVLSRPTSESKELTFATKETQHDIFNAMGAMYAASAVHRNYHATSVQPVISIERFVTVEFPYILVQSLIYGTIFYSLGSFEWTAAKFLWYLFFMYFTLLYFTFYGMMTTAITPNHTVAPIIAAPFYTLWNLFSGFMIPRKVSHPRVVAMVLLGQPGVVDALRPPDLSVRRPGPAPAARRRRHPTTVAAFLEEHFGFRHDFLGVVAAMVTGFSVLFAVVFALAIKYLNFQRR
ncbi:hypothetical protein HU200_008726 [Digitaria exilis]|uniref:ABC transporter domain-containing protein n=1 Tax=Digitaria exilis TaxID=1010633 RepID=A0A835FNC1_9POAL|nr:hypothetical protein HU200_008726 [Digitaria exilis]